MSSSFAAPRFVPRADHIRARVERHLRRYPAAVQGAVRAAARVHPHVADLAVSFPGLLFAVATAPRGARRERLIAAVLAGEPLAALAARAGLPLWLRKLPPEAFACALPPLPDGPLFRRQIVNHLPSPQRAAAWLDAVAHAARWGHEGLAVWYAREIVRDASPKPKADVLSAVSLWAWYAQLPADVGFVTRPWHPAMNFRTALALADAWRWRVILHLNIGAAPLADMWLRPGLVCGYEFAPLDCAQAIAAEAAAMDNCVMSYGAAVALNRTRLWSIRKDGARVATVSIVNHGDHPLLSIGELQLASNRRAPNELWLIARQWLNGHDLLKVDAQPLTWNETPLDGTRWRSFWKPYWLAKGCFPAWLPLAPSRAALQAL